MAWETPKTDWYGYTDPDGTYTGDRFNATDFNRIKNNIAHLREMAIGLHKGFSIVSLGGDRTVRDYFYADEINQLEENLNTVNMSTLRIDYGGIPEFEPNGYTMGFSDLNRLEGAILDLYNRFLNEYAGRRTFTWNFGMKGGEL